MIRSILLSFAFFLPCAAFAQKEGEIGSICPPYLQLGDTVGLVAPAGRLPARTDTARIRERFASWGLYVKYGPHCCDDSESYFSAPDVQRAADLQAMLDDPSIKAVIACRGGYGSVRLLPWLRLEGLRGNPKWVVGFSDITTLHLSLSHLGIESIHGTMPGSFLFREEDVSAESLRRALFGLTRRIDVPAHPLNCPGQGRGRLTGGNLTVLCAACGTPEGLDFEEPTVLFIEEVGEHVYRVDRMLQQLLRSGVLYNVQAVVVGDFTRMSGAEQFGVDDVCEVVAANLRMLGIPLLFGLPAGHDKVNEALYLGREVSVSVDEEGGHILFAEK
ncbi:MAG: LD-carboxypeptidase [Alistipes sp.]|nr:LD-carboxypeptidase [Alistipes sp.]